jgi:hypothetical protein
VIISLNSINELFFVMVTGFHFEVRTEFVNIIYVNFGFKVLISFKDKFTLLLFVYVDSVICGITFFCTFYLKCENMGDN